MRWAYKMYQVFPYHSTEPDRVVIYIVMYVTKYLMLQRALKLIVFEHINIV